MIVSPGFSVPTHSACQDYLQCVGLSDAKDERLQDSPRKTDVLEGSYKCFLFCLSSTREFNNLRLSQALSADRIVGTRGVNPIFE